MSQDKDNKDVKTDEAAKVNLYKLAFDHLPTVSRLTEIKEAIASALQIAADSENDLLIEAATQLHDRFEKRIPLIVANQFVEKLDAVVSSVTYTTTCSGGIVVSKLESGKVHAVLTGIPAANKLGKDDAELSAADISAEIMAMAQSMWKHADGVFEKDASGQPIPQFTDMVMNVLSEKYARLNAALPQQQTRENLSGLADLAKAVFKPKDVTGEMKFKFSVSEDKEGNFKSTVSVGGAARTSKSTTPKSGGTSAAKATFTVNGVVHANNSEALKAALTAVNDVAKWDGYARSESGALHGISAPRELRKIAKDNPAIVQEN